MPDSPGRHSDSQLPWSEVLAPHVWLLAGSLRCVSLSADDNVQAEEAGEVVDDADSTPYPSDDGIPSLPASESLQYDLSTLSGCLRPGSCRIKHEFFGT